MSIERARSGVSVSREPEVSNEPLIRVGCSESEPTPTVREILLNRDRTHPALDVERGDRVKLVVKPGKPAVKPLEHWASWATRERSLRLCQH